MILTSECMTTLRVCADAVPGSRAKVAAAAACAAHFTIRHFTGRMCCLLVLFGLQSLPFHGIGYATDVPGERHTRDRAVFARSVLSLRGVLEGEVSAKRTEGSRATLMTPMTPQLRWGGK